MSENRIFRIGCDVGQKVDHSAVCLGEELGNRVVVRLLVKYDLGTSYPVLIQTLADLYHSVSKQGDVYSFAIDATGVGAAPTSMLQEALPETMIEPFIFTNKIKRELVGKVKVLHSFGRLKFATRKGDELYNRTLSQLITEMKQLQVKVIKEDASSPEIEIFKTGQHDDLFTALSLTVKDVDLGNPTWEDAVAFIEDKSWVKTPLDEGMPQPSVIFF